MQCFLHPTKSGESIMISDIRKAKINGKPVKVFKVSEVVGDPNKRGTWSLKGESTAPIRVANEDLYRYV